VLPAGRLCNRILAVDGLLSTWDLLSVKQTALRANWLSFVYRSLSSQLQKLQSLASKVTATCITVSLLCRCLSPSFCVNILCIFDFELPCCCCWLGRATGSASDLYSPVYSARSDSTQQAVELSWVESIGRYEQGLKSVNIGILVVVIWLTPRRVPVSTDVTSVSLAENSQLCWKLAVIASRVWRAGVMVRALNLWSADRANSSQTTLHFRCNDPRQAVHTHRLGSITKQYNVVPASPVGPDALPLGR